MLLMRLRLSVSCSIGFNARRRIKVIYSQADSRKPWKAKSPRMDRIWGQNFHIRIWEMFGDVWIWRTQLKRKGVRGTLYHKGWEILLMTSYRAVTNPPQSDEKVPQSKKWHLRLLFVHMASFYFWFLAGISLQIYASSALWESWFINLTCAAIFN